jgi:hypothetical protein
MRPVYQFGDKDGGPQKSLDGDAAENSSDPDGDAAEKAADADAGEPPASTDDTAKPDDQAKSANQVAKDIDLPEVAADDVHPENDGPKSEGDGSMTANFALEKKPENVKPSKDGAKPGAKSADKADGQAASEPKLRRAKKLFSTKEESGSQATTAMGDIPRDIRVGMLCQSELLAQLRHGSPAYSPIILPTYRGGDGNEISVARAAFRDQSGWYDVSFKCDVDSDATKVVSFSYGVGSAVPHSEWRNRGFPED